MANTDYFTEVGTPGSATSLSTPGHSVGNQTWKVGSTAGFPPVGKSVIFAADTYTNQTINGQTIQVRTAGSYTEWEADVTDATTVSNAIIRFGTDQAYLANSFTRIYIPVASSRENRLVQGILAEHQQNGQHANINTQSITNNGNYAQPSGTFTIPNGAIKAPYLGTDASWAWTSYTPTFTNITLGNGTVVAKYTQTGKTVQGKFSLTFGSSTTVGTGGYTVSLPVTAATGYSAATVLGAAYWNNPGSESYQGLALMQSTTAANFVASNLPSDTRLVQATSNKPLGSYPAGTQFSFSFSYESA